MAGPWPTELRLDKDKRVLTVSFDDGQSFALPAELLRVLSPSAEVQGHSEEQRVTVAGKKAVAHREARAGRQLRGPHRLRRRPRHRPLRLGVFARARREQGSALAELHLRLSAKGLTR